MKLKILAQFLVTILLFFVTIILLAVGYWPIAVFTVIMWIEMMADLAKKI